MTQALMHRSGGCLRACRCQQEWSGTFWCIGSINVHRSRNALSRKERPVGTTTETHETKTTIQHNRDALFWRDCFRE